MFDEPFRQRLAPLLNRVAAPLVRRGVSPNHITILGCALALVAAALVASGRPGFGLTLWLVSRIGDGLDGAVARQGHRESAFGGYLDISLDMTAYAAMVVGFAVAAPALWLAWLAVMAGYVLVITTTLALSDAARVSGRSVSGTNRTFQFTRGIAEAGETSTIYVLWVLLPGYLEGLAWLWATLLLATAVQRTWLAARLLR